MLRDLLFTMQARWLATHHSRQAPTRRYYFSYVPELLRPDQPHGVPHGGEIVFPFNTGDIAHGTSGKFTDADRAMAQKLSDYWFSFAETGTPAGAKAWPLHELKGLVVVDNVLELGEAIEVRADFRKTRLEIYASQYPKLEAAIGG
jgi:para-nitrobenzyl esterase